jgi:nitroreductase
VEVLPTEVLEAIKTKHSSGAFKPNPINRDVMENILQGASNSPSYTNTQPWEVVVLSGKKRDELSRRLVELAKVKAPTRRDLPTPRAGRHRWRNAPGNMALGDSTPSGWRGMMRKGEKNYA